MPLAILAHSVGEVAQAPVFPLLDLAAIVGDQLGKAVGESIDLCARYILACDEHILVERHSRPNPFWLIEARGASADRAEPAHAGKGEPAHYTETLPAGQDGGRRFQVDAGRGGLGDGLR